MTCINRISRDTTYTVLHYVSQHINFKLDNKLTSRSFANGATALKGPPTLPRVATGARAKKCLILVASVGFRPNSANTIIVPWE